MKKLLLGTIVCLVLLSCEETIDAELPYEKKIVINATLEAGQPVNDIMITRNVEPLYRRYYYEIEDFIIPDAKVTLTEIDGPVHELEFNDELYTWQAGASNPIISQGSSYRIDVEWDGLHAWAQTTVPEAVEIDTVIRKFERKDWYVPGEDWYSEWDAVYYAVVSSETPCVFIPGIVTAGHGFSDYMWDSWNYRPSSAREDDGNVLIRLENYDAWDTTETYFSTYEKDGYLRVYDQDIYTFLETEEYGDSDFFFGMGGQNVIGNIKGDGIGLFVGYMITDSYTFHP